MHLCFKNNTLNTVANELNCVFGRPSYTVTEHEQKHAIKVTFVRVQPLHRRLAQAEIYSVV